MTAPASPTTALAPFSPPGTMEYAAATTAYQFATPVEPIVAFTARSVDDVVRAVASARRLMHSSSVAGRRGFATGKHLWGVQRPGSADRPD